jgi:hypothetical protein
MWLNHLGLFNTCFKRRFGTSPGRWRKSTIRAVGASAHKPENKPSCPLHATGLCPLGGKLEVFPPAIVTTIAGKLTDGVNILEDLKRRDLTFGVQALSKIKHTLPETRVAK